MTKTITIILLLPMFFLLFNSCGDYEILNISKFEFADIYPAQYGLLNLEDFSTRKNRILQHEDNIICILSLKKADSYSFLIFNKSSREKWIANGLRLNQANAIINGHKSFIVELLDSPNVRSGLYDITCSNNSRATFSILNVKALSDRSGYLNFPLSGGATLYYNKKNKSAIVFWSLGNGKRYENFFSTPGNDVYYCELIETNQYDNPSDHRTNRKRIINYYKINKLFTSNEKLFSCSLPKNSRERANVFNYSTGNGIVVFDRHGTSYKPSDQRIIEFLLINFYNKKQSIRTQSLGEKYHVVDIALNSSDGYFILASMKKRGPVLISVDLSGKIKAIISLRNIEPRMGPMLGLSVHDDKFHLLYTKVITKKHGKVCIAEFRLKIK